MTDRTDTAVHNQDWIAGHEAGRNGLVASQMIFRNGITWSDFNAGYAVGAKERLTTNQTAKRPGPPRKGQTGAR